MILAPDRPKRRGAKHRALRDLLRPAQRRELMACAEAALDSRLVSDREFTATFARREQGTLLSLAAVYRDSLSRTALRSLAKAICRKYYLRRIRTDRGYWERFRIAGGKHLKGTDDVRAGRVFAAFHFADYRLLAPLLVQNGFQVVWLADADNAVRVRRQFTEGRINDYLPAGGDAQLTVEMLGRSVQCVQSTDPGAAWQIIKRVREGASVVLFPDGNSGADEGHGSSSIRLRCLGRTIRARTGAAMIAYAAGASIIPIVPYDDEGRPAVRFFSPIKAARGESIKAFGVRGTAQLFRLLEEQIKRDPSAWEEWHNFYRWIEAPESAPPSRKNSASLSACSGADRLALDPSLWWLSIGGEYHAIDVDALRSVGSHPGLEALIAFAERGATVEQWLRRVPNAKEGLELLEHLVSLGLVPLHAAACAKRGSVERRTVPSILDAAPQ